MKCLQDKTALITGNAAGIAVETAPLFLASDDAVYNPVVNTRSVAVWP